MFDFLKKKISGFVEKLTKKEEDKEPKEREILEIPVEEKPSEKLIAKKPVPKKADEKPASKKIEEKPAPKKPEAKPKPKEKPASAPKKEEAIKKPEPRQKTKAKKEPKPGQKEPATIEAESIEPEIPEPEHLETGSPEIMEPEEEKPEEAMQQETGRPEPETAHRKPETPKALPQYREEKDKKKGVSLSPFKAIKSFITREVEISQGDVNDLLDNLELEMLEADVELGVAELIRQELQSKLVGSKIKKENLDSHIKQIISGTFVDLMSSENPLDLLQFVEAGEKPIKIVFFGLNGTGKTTTIGKVAHLLMQNKKKVVFAAADTFRAAAIEQMQVHADRLEVKLIKRDYGADPTSVGYDAVSYAKAHGIDAVLIDTAGRQDTNINLINELKKMERVLKPDLKIYVGESIAGSSMIEQIRTFHKEIGIDGVILTKLDCDPKGGTVLSITKATGIPVVYIGVGQKYEDLEPFDAHAMAKRILS